MMSIVLGIVFDWEMGTYETVIGTYDKDFMARFAEMIE